MSISESSAWESCMWNNSSMCFSHSFTRSRRHPANEIKDKKIILSLQVVKRKRSATTLQMTIYTNVKGSDSVIVNTKILDNTDQNLEGFQPQLVTPTIIWRTPKSILRLKSSCMRLKAILECSKHSHRLSRRNVSHVYS